MRGAGVGLIGLLLAAGLIFWMMMGDTAGNKGTVKAALEAKDKAETVTNSISGRDEKGQNVTESIKYETSSKGVLVKSVVAGGALDKKLGLKAGDLITEIGPISADQFAGSDGSARDFMMSQYGRPDEWTVIRNGQKIHLPSERNTPVASPAITKKEEPKPVPQVAPAEKKPEEAAAQPAQPPVHRTTAKGQAMDLVNQIEQGQGNK